MGEPKVYYLLICRDCVAAGQRPLPIPFGTAGERGKWAAGHTRGTGHDRWWVDDQAVAQAEEGDGE